MSDIADVIFNEYVEELRERNTPNILNDIMLLRDNNLAVSLSETNYLYTEEPGLYRLGSKFMCKYNPSLKEFRRQLGYYEFGGEYGSKADTNPKLLKVAQASLEKGVYYAQFDSSNFALFSVTSNNEDAAYMYNAQLVFIGEDHKYWRNKFEKMRKKYTKLYTSQKHEFIVNMPSFSHQPAIFKPFDHVIFKEKENVIKYIDNWLNNVPEYYNKYKMIPKLSVILYGDPGTGKSTFGKALARYLDIQRVVNVDPGSFDYDSDGRYDPFGRLRNADYSYVMSLDDIDCYCESRETSKNSENNETVASLLSFLDNPPTTNIKCKDGMRYPVSIIVASTNYYDKLDSAVKRYGRFDLKIHMPLFEKPEAQQMCDLYGLQLENLVDGTNEKDFKISPAELQAKCLENIDKSLKQSG